MLSTLEGTTLGVWISHGEGKFKLPYSEDKYNIVANMLTKDILPIQMVLILTPL
jgi:hypothetical protein